MAEMITIPLAEYDQLVAAAEQLADLAAFDRAVALDDEGMPHDILARILNGENPVRVIRDWRGMSAAELARVSGVNRVQVHEIETGKKHGSVATVRKLAEALRVGMEELV